jgi:hypothetical protein
MVTEFNSTLTYSYNFAYGGATTDAELIPPYSPEVRSFVDQVKIFTDNVASKPAYAPWTPENASAALLLILFPPFLTLLGTRFSVYEEVSAYSYLAALALFVWQRWRFDVVAVGRAELTVTLGR